MRCASIVGILLTVTCQIVNAQEEDSAFVMTGVIYDEDFRPANATHVININSRQGDVSDTLGIFRIPVHKSDTLLVRNISFREKLVPVRDILGSGRIVLERKFYPLQEARVFEWGSSYGDFQRAIIQMPTPQTLADNLGLPRQDPDYVPLEMDEEAIKSPALLLKSPLSYFYYNFSKEAKSARRYFWVKKNRLKQERFDQITSPENLSSVTGLEGDALMKFMAYLFQQMKCDIHCLELDLYAEIHTLWKIYQEL